jgi:hypothetical protein
VISTDHPVIQTVAIPIVVAFVATGLLRLAGGSRRGGAVAGLGVGLGMLAAYGAIFGIPGFPPAGATNKLFYVIAVGAAIGFVVDLLRPPHIATRSLVVLASLAGILWIAGDRAASEPWPAGLVVAVLAVVAAIGGWRLAGRPAEPTEGGAMLLVAAIALAVSALIGNTISSAQLGGATAAALGGFLLWNWPRPRFALGGGAVLPAMALLAAMTAQIALFTRIEAYALLPLALVFVADLAARRLSLGTGRMAQALQPIVLGLIAALPAAATVALVYITTPQTSGTY